MKKWKKGLIVSLFICLAALMLPGQAQAASKRLFNIVVKDGYTTQTIEMKYGKSPYGYTAYYASQSAIYVNPKSKKVTFQVKKNTSSRYGNFSFASKTIKPGDQPKGNLFTYTTDGKRRAWMFTVQKISEPKIRYVRIYPSVKGKTYMPGKNKFVKIKTSVTAETPAKVTIRVINREGKTVYRKNYPESGSKTYTLKWNGKPSRKNPAGWKTTRYVEDGEYTVRVTATLLAGGEKQEFQRETKLIVGKK